MLGWRRTHKDPFAGEWEQIFSLLMANPEAIASLAERTTDPIKFDFRDISYQ